MIQHGLVKTSCDQGSRPSWYRAAEETGLCFGENHGQRAAISHPRIDSLRHLRYCLKLEAADPGQDIFPVGKEELVLWGDQQRKCRAASQCSAASY